MKACVVAGAQVIAVQSPSNWNDPSIHSTVSPSCINGDPNGTDPNTFTYGLVVIDADITQAVSR